MSKRSTPAIVQAARLGYLEELIEICSNGNVDLDECTWDGCSALIAASRKGYIDCVDFLLTAGASVNITENHGFSALSEASNYNHYECVKRLLQANDILDLHSKDKRTALMRASINGHVECVGAILDDERFLKGINAQNTYGSTALHLASHRCHVEVAERLVDNGCSMSIVDKYGNTALHAAAIDGSDDILLLIIKNCPEIINWRRNDQRTAIMLAAQRGNTNAFEILLRAGADISLRDARGQNALELLHWSLCDAQTETLHKLVDLFSARKEVWLRRCSFIFFLVGAGYLPLPSATAEENDEALTMALEALGIKFVVPDTDEEEDDLPRYAIAEVFSQPKYHKLVLRYI